MTHKPKNLSFCDAASLPLAGVTALQVLKQYEGSLEGKTVFIPAGCKTDNLHKFGACIFPLTNIEFLSVSGTGALACQLAKNVFHAGKVITTVSTSKIPKVPELLGKDVVDQSGFLYTLAQASLIHLLKLSIIPSTRPPK